MKQNDKPLTFFEVFVSVLAAAFGVQKQRNMERDFTRGEIRHFIVAGIIFTMAFVIGLILLVNAVIANLLT